MAEHASLGASSAYRWIACPGSIRMAASAPPQRTSRFALEGTIAHALLEWCATNHRTPDEMVGRKAESFINDEALLFEIADVFPDFEVEEEMAEGVQLHIDEVTRPLTNAAQLWHEKVVNLAALDPPAPMFGTADTIVWYADTEKLRVIDFKYGRGVAVEAVGNHQLRYYALGAWLDASAAGRSVKSVEAVIVQPRAPHRDGPVRAETIDPMDLYEWSADLLAFARATQAPDAPLVAGDHCRFCPALPICPAVRDRALAVAQTEFSALPSVTLPPPDKLSPDQLADILSGLDLLEQWGEAVKAHAHHLLDVGTPIPGWKLVAKRARRAWVDETTIEAVLTSPAFGIDMVDCYADPKLRSPAQIEKLLTADAKKRLAGFVTKGESTGSTLAREADKRPAIGGSAANDFDVIDGGAAEQ